MKQRFRFPWAAPLVVGLALALGACSSKSNDDTNALVGDDPLKNTDGSAKVFAEFEPVTQVMPLPNDVVWAADGTPQVSFELSDRDPLKPLKAAINTQGLLGLSPNMFLTVPVTESVDPETLKVFVFCTSEVLPFLQALGRQDQPAAVAAAAAIDVRTEADFVVKAEDGIVKLLPRTPFKAGKGYAALVKKTLEDSRGNLVAPSMGMATLLETRTPLTRGHPYFSLEPLRAAFNDANAATHAPGLLDIAALVTGYRLAPAPAWSRDDLLLAWTFNTAPSALSLPSSQGEFTALPYTDLAVLPERLKGASANRWTGHAPRWLTDTGDEAAAPTGVSLLQLYQDLAVSGAPQDVLDRVGYTLTYTPTGIDKVYFGEFDSASFPTLGLPSPTAVSVPFLLVTPSTGAKPYPVVVFQHGITRDRYDALLTASAYTRRGLAVLAIDATNHGARFAGEPFFTANLIKDRANFYQAAFDLWETFDMLEENAIDLDGDTAVDLRQSDNRFASHSLGSLIASVFLSQDTRPARIHLASPAAQLANVVDDTNRPDIAGLVTALGYVKGTTSYYVFLNIAQWLLDPIDGSYNGIGSNDPGKVLALSAYGDPTVSENSSFTFYTKANMGSPVGTPVSVAPPFDGAVPAAGAYRFGNAQNPLIHFFSMAPLINPETEPWYKDYSPQVQADANVAAQLQAATFLSDPDD